MKKITKDDIHQTLATEKVQKYSKRKYLWLLGVVLLLLGAYYFTKSDSNKIVEYNTAKVTKGDLIVTVSATGNLEPTNSVNVGIEVSGTILEIYVDYNDIVKKGDVLARLDTNKLESQVNSTKAALDVATANLLESKIGVRDAKRELQRVEELFKATDGNYPSTKDIDAARITYEKSKASYKALVAQEKQAKALLETNKEDLKKAIVLSPMDGVVLDKAVDVGQSVVASMQIPTLFSIAQDLKSMEVIVSVDEADIGGVRKGQDVTFTVDAYPSKVFKGVIKQVRVNSEIVDNVVTYETVVSVDNADLLLRPGMTVSADITTKVIKDALLIPNAALRFTPPVQEQEEQNDFALFGPSTKQKEDLSINSQSIWVLENGQAQKKKIQLGESDSVKSEVVSGNITVDSQVIIDIKE